MFRICKMCETAWETKKDFILDKNIELVGYQANFTHANLGFFLFGHLKEGCTTSLMIKVEEFLPAEMLKIPLILSPGSPGCQGHCASGVDLEMCSNSSCVGSKIREIMQIVRHKDVSRLEL